MISPDVAERKRTAINLVDDNFDDGKGNKVTSPAVGKKRTAIDLVSDDNDNDKTAAKNVITRYFTSTRPDDAWPAGSFSRISETECLIIV